MNSKNILVVAGEQSGDHHLSKVVSEFKKINSSVQFWGIAGDYSLKNGVEICFHNRELAVVGIKEVVKHFPVIYRAFNGILKEVDQRKPSACLLVDYPDFNLRLAKKLYQRGVPVYYYISPQVWAWRSGRVSMMKRVLRKLYVILPFEEEFFKERGMEVKYVGHPLLDEEWVHQDYDREKLKEELFLGKLNPLFPLVSLLPGSRSSEWEHMLPILLGAAGKILEAIPNCQFSIPVASHLDFEVCQRKISEMTAEHKERFFLLKGRSIDSMRCSDLNLVASGTATLEAGVVGNPLLVTYRVSPVSASLFKLLTHYRGFIALVNLVAGAEVAKEFIQDLANPEAIATESIRILQGESHALQLKEGLKVVRDRLGDPGGSLRVARDLDRELHQG